MDRETWLNGDDTTTPKPKPRSAWQLFRDSFLEAATHSPFGAEGAMRHLGIGRPEGATDEDLNKAERFLSEKYQKAREQDEAAYADDDTFSPRTIGRKAVELVGGVLGGVDPTYVLAPGRSAAQRMGAQGAINMGMDAASQGVELHRGVRDEFNKDQNAMAGAGGVVLQGAGEIIARQKGKTLGLDGAVGIGNKFGTVTSTKRSAARNKKVGGAKNSHHLYGRAIDIARGKGVSHKQIERAYRRAGYDIIESLDEGDHSHFAFRFGGGGKRPPGGGTGRGIMEDFDFRPPEQRGDNFTMRDDVDPDNVDDLLDQMSDEEFMRYAGVKYGPVDDSNVIPFEKPYLSPYERRAGITEEDIDPVFDDVSQRFFDDVEASAYNNMPEGTKEQLDALRGLESDDPQVRARSLEAYLAMGGKVHPKFEADIRAAANNVTSFPDKGFQRDEGLTYHQMLERSRQEVAGKVSYLPDERLKKDVKKAIKENKTQAQMEEESYWLARNLLDYIKGGGTVDMDQLRGVQSDAVRGLNNAMGGPEERIQLWLDTVKVLDEAVAYMGERPYPGHNLTQDIVEPKQAPIRDPANDMGGKPIAGAVRQDMGVDRSQDFQNPVSEKPVNKNTGASKVVNKGVVATTPINDVNALKRKDQFLQDGKGNPIVFYHGAKRPYEGLPSSQMNRTPPHMVLYATDPEIASRYALDGLVEDGEKAFRVFPVYIDKANFGDFRNPAHVKKVAQWLAKEEDEFFAKHPDSLRGPYSVDQIARGSWSIWENPWMLRDLGWKGAWVTESMGDGKTALNLAVMGDKAASSVFEKFDDTPTVDRSQPPAMPPEPPMNNKENGFEAGPGPKGGDDTPDPYANLTPEEKLMKAIKEARPLSREQRKLNHEERVARASKLSNLQKQGGGLEGYHQELAALKGQLPKVDFESIAEHFKQEDFDELLRKIQTSNSLLPYEKITAQTALMKLLGAEGAKVPTTRELKFLSEIFDPKMIDALLQNRPLKDKLWEGLSNALNLPRSLMASFDLSAPFRQGVFMIGRKEFWKNFVTMFKAFGSKKVADEIEAGIKARPSYQMMKKAGLGITTGNQHFLDAREEQFMSSWAEKIPLIGKGVQMSERAYRSFLNRLRADVFDDLMKKGEDLGINYHTNKKALKDLARYINAATGRGDLSALLGKHGNAAAPFLSGLFFSPRLMASRIQMLNPAFYATLDPMVRKESIKDLMKFSMAATSVISLMSLDEDITVETDPRSADFAKIKMGNTRFDTLGGFQQYIRLFSQLLTGETVTLAGKERKLGDPKQYKSDTRWDVILRFFRTKFSPVAAYAADAADGQNIIGEEFNAGKDALESFIPLFVQDLNEAIEEFGAEGVLTAVPAIFGVGVQTYKPRPEKIKKKDFLKDEKDSFLEEDKREKWLKDK